ncbi:unnamed protein product [Dracunculus medinensis]|uniref:MYND-type domain-containing protein n=1 Tax=Dracunculus medinensis TaxID=318479 RepID=A0A0N4U7C8_DRAME|nr:unnamed protein product [Dracunculus medinensis]
MSVGRKYVSPLLHSAFEAKFALLQLLSFPLVLSAITSLFMEKSVYERLRIFGEPFVYLCNNNKVSKYCSNCLRIPKERKLYLCGKCEFAQYCDKDCQRFSWKFHRNECRRLKSVFPNLPLTEVLFLSRVIDRVIFLEENGDKYKWQKERRWSDLIGHQDDIRNDPIKYAHFEKIYGKMELFRKDEMIDKKKFFDIFCKISINAHSIHSSAGNEIGMAIDFGVSAYDHSCRPNCSLVFDGYRACLRPLTPNTDAKNPEVSFISYIDLGRSRYQRRKELQAKYFHCECSRCSDPADNILTSIRCVNPTCDEPLITTEDAEPCAIICAKCSQEASLEHVEKCQKFMINLPDKFDVDIDVKLLEELFEKATALLHSKNIYVTRLQTAILHIQGTLGNNLQFIQKNVYENYKMCFPHMDRHIAFHLLHIVKSLIEKGERFEVAAPYAYEAMNIFEVCFGLEHPYYLQTLALWTFLDTKAQKTNDELFALMNLESNTPIDISQYLFK